VIWEFLQEEICFWVRQKQGWIFLLSKFGLLGKTKLIWESKIIKMNKKELEAETKRIEENQNEIKSKIDSLDKDIFIYSRCAWGCVIIGFVAALSAIIYFFNFDFSRNEVNNFNLNLLGDFMAGLVASIWSLAGLFFIYVAFLGQKQQLLNQQIEICYSQLELKYTRLELKYTRFELKGQKEEMIAHNKTLNQQKFENTFFQLLGLFNSIVNTLDYKNNNTIFSSGRDSFRSFYDKMRNNMKKNF